jgi:dienelactone hydrolase
MRLGVAVLGALLGALPLSAQVRIEAPLAVWGYAPNLRVLGLAPSEEVRLHLFRGFVRWDTDDPTRRSGWKPVPVALHAWADFRVDKKGKIDISRQSALAGTYKGRDPYGLWWSGRKPSDALLAPVTVEGFDPASLKDGEARIVVTRNGQIIGSAAVASRSPEGLRTSAVAEGTLNGTFAAPADGRRHPTLILLHGSEGGDRDASLAMAQRFAGQGFAAFALNYFAWDLKELNGVPNSHVNQPIELLDRVRTWLSQQPEADVDRLGVYGHSKGAEFATLAATYLPWIKAVAACVPSDSVWEGYGIGDPRNRSNPVEMVPSQISSWSWQGQPLPYIALPTTDDRSKFFNNTAYYEYRRAVDPKAATAARIPVERSRAHFLWIGGGRDETWASGAMAKRNDLAMKKAGRGRFSVLGFYPKASHAICGDGTYPTRLWADDSPDPRKPDLSEDGRATVDAWYRIVAFFRRVL